MLEVLNFAKANGIPEEYLSSIDPEIWLRDLRDVIDNISFERDPRYSDFKIYDTQSFNQIEASFDQRKLDYLFNNPQYAYTIRTKYLGYLARSKHPRMMQLYNAIASDPKTTFNYAMKENGGERFKLGEPAILNGHPMYIIEYASLVIKGRWKEGEDAILNKRENRVTILPYWDRLSRYVTPEDRVNGNPRWLEAEPLLLKHKKLLQDAVYYCSRYIKNRWPELEKSILANDNKYGAFAAVDYAELIMGYGNSSPFSSELYPTRWEAVEPLILKYPEALIKYVSRVLPYSEDRPQGSYFEAGRFIWPEAQKILYNAGY